MDCPRRITFVICSLILACRSCSLLYLTSIDAHSNDAKCNIPGTSWNKLGYKRPHSSDVRQTAHALPSANQWVFPQQKPCGEQLDQTKRQVTYVQASAYNWAGKHGVVGMGAGTNDFLKEIRSVHLLSYSLRSLSSIVLINIESFVPVHQKNTESEEKL